MSMVLQGKKCGATFSLPVITNRSVYRGCDVPHNVVDSQLLMAIAVRLAVVEKKKSLGDHHVCFACFQE